jgi:hypothetical protein
VLVLMLGLSVSLAGEGTPERVSVAQEPAWRESVRQFAQQHFKNPAWGYSHAIRDYALARELATTDAVKLDDDVLFAAAYLHDMAAFPPWAKEGIDHADQAASAVEPVLKEAGFPLAKLEAVRGAIRTHMFDRDPVGPEALYLHDADALDWLGAIGVARILALVDPNGGRPAAPDVVPMLDSNLAKVPARVLSPAGRGRIADRQLELERFLRDLRRESDNLQSL